VVRDWKWSFSGFLLSLAFVSCGDADHGRQDGEGGGGRAGPRGTRAGEAGTPQGGDGSSGRNAGGRSAGGSTTGGVSNSGGTGGKMSGGSAAKAGSPAGGGADSDAGATTGGLDAGAAGSSGAAASLGDGGEGGAGELGDLGPLHEIRFGASSVPSSPDCSAMWPNTVTQLRLAGSCGAAAKPCAVLELPSIVDYRAEATSVTRTESELVLFGSWPRSSHRAQERVERLRLPLAGSSLAGGGTAQLRRTCPGLADQVYDVPVTVGPDETPPTIHHVPADEFFAPYAVSWGQFYIDATEPIIGFLDHSGDVPAILGLENVTPPNERPALAPATLLGWGFLIEDVDRVSGTKQRFFFQEPLFDRAGNTAESQSEPIQFATDTLVDGVFDFDDDVPEQSAGGGVYFAPGAANSPCESGGCLVLGPVEPCHQHGAPAFFSMRFATDRHVRVRVRAKVESSVEAPRGLLAYIDEVQYTRSSVSTGAFSAQPVSDGLGFSTGFRDASTVTQSIGPRGGAIAFDCQDGEDHGRMRAIIERIEVTPSGLD
jgi:hypothetical protein